MTTASSPIGGGGSDAAFARQSNLDDWKARHVYPKIHDAIFAAYLNHCVGDRGCTLDLGCSTGLLGRRIADTGASVVWADGDGNAAQRGTEAGVIDAAYGRLWCRKLDPDSWPDFVNWLRGFDVRTVVARRVLCVLSDVVPADVIRQGFADAGVRTILLEGQKVDKRSVQRNARAGDQVAYLSPDFGLIRNCGGDVRLLRKVVNKC